MYHPHFDGIAGGPLHSGWVAEILAATMKVVAGISQSIKLAVYYSST
jgi:hypothetical protein